MLEIERKPTLKEKINRLGSSPQASWETYMRFLLMEEMSTCPVRPPLKKGDPPYPYWPAKSAQQTDQGWIAEFDELGRYAGGLANGVKEKGVSREMLRVRRNKAAVRLNNAAPQYIRDMFPLERLGTRRPIPECMDKKVNGPRKIRDLIIKSIRNGEWDARGLQNYFNSLTPAQIEKLIREKVLFSLGVLANMADIHAVHGRSGKLSEIACELKSLGIPVAISNLEKKHTRQSYYAVLNEHPSEGEKHSVIALLKSPLFNRFREA